MDIGSKIKELRSKKNLTQKELARISEIAEITIRKYENGERKPKIEQLQKIAKVLDVTVDELLGHSNDSFEDNSPEEFYEYEQCESHIRQVIHIFDLLGYEIKQIGYPEKITEISLNRNNSTLKYSFAEFDKIAKQIIDKTSGRLLADLSSIQAIMDFSNPILD